MQYIVTAYAEKAAGPGWGNRPIWVVLRDEAGNMSTECIQPEHQSAEMITLYEVSQATHLAMKKAVRTYYREAEGKS